MPGCYIRNLVTFGPVVSEEKSFETEDGRRTDDGGFPYYKLPRSLRLGGANYAFFEELVWPQKVDECLFLCNAIHEALIGIKTVRKCIKMYEQHI